MAKLTSMPELAVIDQLKGAIDFYLWLGIPVARRWPRSPGQRRAPSVEAQWNAFGWASSVWNSMPDIVREAYANTAIETDLTPRDLFTKSVISDYFREGQWEA